MVTWLKSLSWTQIIEQWSIPQYLILVKLYHFCWALIIFLQLGSKWCPYFEYAKPLYMSTSHTVKTYFLYMAVRYYLLQKHGSDKPFRSVKNDLVKVTPPFHWFPLPKINDTYLATNICHIFKKSCQRTFEVRGSCNTYFLSNIYHNHKGAVAFP